jgi:hypothetical protein
VRASALTPTNSESDEPEDGKNDRSDPQKVHGKSGTEENQHKQQCEYEYHAATFPTAIDVKRQARTEGASCSRFICVTMGIEMAHGSVTGHSEQASVTSLARRR